MCLAGNPDLAMRPGEEKGAEKEKRKKDPMQDFI